jgi:hypothetical protein
MDETLADGRPASTSSSHKRAMGENAGDQPSERPAKRPAGDSVCHHQKRERTGFSSFSELGNDPARRRPNELLLNVSWFPARYRIYQPRGLQAGLPPGWEAFIHEPTGLTLYMHRDTCVCSVTRPYALPGNGPREVGNARDANANEDLLLPSQCLVPIS